MSEQNCGTCKHWENDGEGVAVTVHSTIGWHWRQESDPRLEVLAEYNRNCGECKAVEPGWDYDDVDQLPKATVWDSEEYVAVLVTHKTFGCVLWEPK